VTSSSIIGLRALVTAGAIVWMWAGPMHDQVLRGRSEVLRGWQMFAGAGLATTEVHFYTRDAEGIDRTLDRYALLAPNGERPRSLTHLKDAAAVKKVAQRLCRKLGDGADVRAGFRTATRMGWKRRLGREENLCDTE
jgi:hypothetical protein